MPRPTHAEFPSLGPPLRRSEVAIRPGSHRTLGSLALVLAAAVAGLAPASADVTFTPEFEPGSKWFTEPWSPAARAEMEAYFSDLGQLFTGSGQVVVTVTDDQQSAYASAGATWSEFTGIEGRDGLVSAPSLWWIIVKGVDENGAASDAEIDWNMDVAGLYGGNSSQLVNNIRGLARHEMHHAFGSSSSLFHSSSFDPRGTQTTVALIDSFYRDANDAPLLGAFNAVTRRFTINNYALAPDWTTAQNQSGLYLEARTIRGQIAKMPPISFNGQIDFSHVTGIAYVSDHPSWRNYEDTDRAFLRALGYPLAADAQLTLRAPMVGLHLAGTTAEVTCLSSADSHYRLLTSRDLQQWRLHPRGMPGTGSPITLTLPLPSEQRGQFFQVVQIPQ